MRDCRAKNARTDIEALKIVALVAQQGSFAAAARVLSVDPSSVSRTVASVEAALGLRLFQRSTRSLSVTEEGEVYLSRLVPLLEGLEHAQDDARAVSRHPAGTVRITTSVAFAHTCVVPHLADFTSRYPDISLEILPSDANLDLAANSIDLAIRLAPEPTGDLISAKLMNTRYRVVASPEYLAESAPLSMPTDLQSHNCLRSAMPEFRTRWRFRTMNDDPTEVLVSGNLIIVNALSLRRAALDGLGPALLADWLVKGDIADRTLVDVFPDHDCTATEFDTAAWILYPSRSFLPRKVRVTIDFLRQVLD
ncbi:LysR family transcriptional regulator [Yoonia litorea]|uniref:Transcriptional regulator, LysR family n=1 Tax=Yoonia litorea TaxID=1123755 RepID=A0A1I6MHT3_9RHOB|nr:LysR family transcriptional regulator [Yoonia litorea]SFS15276.1 transcriptional regulator, LysR family [Yoonia litorea]